MDYGIKIESEEYSSSFKNKILVIKALNELLGERKYDDIRVKEICERSCVSRSLFYTYFDNKAAIVKWYLGFSMNKGVNKIGIDFDWFEGHLVTTRVYDDFRYACYCALDSKSFDNTSQYFYEIRRNALYKALSMHNIQVTPKLKFQIEALIAGELAATARWFREIHVKELAGFLVSIVPRDLFEVLNRPITKKDQ